MPPAAFAGRKMLNCASRPPSAADYVRARRWSRRGEVGVISAAAMGRWGRGHGEGESAGRTLNLYLKRVPSKTLLDESCSRDMAWVLAGVGVRGGDVGELGRPIDCSWHGRGLSSLGLLLCPRRSRRSHRPTENDDSARPWTLPRAASPAFSPVVLPDSGRTSGAY